MSSRKSQVTAKQIPLSESGIAPTTDWTALGTQECFNTPTPPIPWGGDAYVFARTNQNALGMFDILNGDWTYFGGALANAPAANYSPNATVAVIALMQNGQVQITYINPTNGNYTAWALLATQPAGTTFTGAPVLTVNSDSRLEAFILDTDGNMWHSYQQQVAPSIVWSAWIQVSPQVVPFNTELPFVVYLQANGSGPLQAVATGTDTNMYQATQNPQAPEGWDDFVLVASGGVNPQFSSGPAAAFCTGTLNGVFAGYNASQSSGNNPLVFAAPPTTPSWSSYSTSTPPLPTSQLVMVSNGGEPQLLWAAGGGAGTSQVQLITGSTGPSFSWSSIVQNVGSATNNITGQLAAMASGGNVLASMLGEDSLVYYINYAPAQD